MVTLIKLLQSLNATSPIASSPSDSVTAIRPLSEKSHSPQVLTEAGTVMFVKLLFRKKAESPILVSPSDSVTDVRPLSPKAQSPIVTTPVKSALIKLLHPLKASFGISSPAGNLIPLIFPLFTYVFSVA